MKSFSEYIGSQFKNPRGIAGKICCIIMNIINQSMYKSVVSSVHLTAQSSLLDIGYGNGYLIQKLYKKYQAYIVGIDISEDMKTAAAKRNQAAVEANKVHLLVGDCCHLVFEKERFDAVTSVNTIYFWEDTLKGMAEIYRVLKKGGTFYNVVYSREWLQKLSYTKKGFRFFEKDDLTALGKQAGFSEVTIKDIALGKNYMVKYKK